MTGVHTIPVVPARDGDPALLVQRFPDRVQDILHQARAHYGPAALHLGDVVSRAWAKSRRLPYLEEIVAVARTVGRAGGWLLNLSFEWGCTCGLVVDADGCPVLLRTLDWQLNGLGRSILVVRRPSPHGEWINLTWPGFVGSVQGVAPGRFAASINFAPDHATGLGSTADRVARKAAVLAHDGLPPVLLLRQVFEECADFAEACGKIEAARLCAPALFTIVGCCPHEQAIVEKTRTAVVVHRTQRAVTNQWLSAHLPGRPRSILSADRLESMTAYTVAGTAPARPFDWIAPPILNDNTRLAMEAWPATGMLRVQGYEAGRPVTSVLETAASCAGRSAH